MLPSFLEQLDPQVYRTRNYAVLDFEIDTSHGDYGNPVHDDNGMLLGSLTLGKDHPAYQGRQTYSIWADEFRMGKVLRLIEAADLLVAHNAKYELMWLRRCGLDLTNTFVFDTKLAEFVLLGNLGAPDETAGRPAYSTSLDMVCRRRGLPVKDPVVDILMGDGINPIAIPGRWVQGRCEQDVETTEEAYLRQVEHLDATNRLSVLYTRCLLTPVLADTEFQGMNLDKDRVEEEYADYFARHAKLDREMNQLTGGINWRSPKQVAEFLYDELGFQELRKYDGSPKRTKAGGRLTDKKTLEKLEAKTEKQIAYIDLKKRLGKVASALSKNLEFFVGVCREKGGVFYATFNQTVVATHRLSSTGIKTWFQTFKKEKTAQFQNLPNVFKPLFTPRREGYFMGETDGSQLEFRVAVHLSRDIQGRHDIISGHDVHTFTASVLNGVSEKDVDKEMRRLAKPHTFKPVYGGQSGTPAEQRYYKAFRERYPELTATQDGWVQTVWNSQNKSLVTPWGMRFYWPRIKMRNGWCNYTSNIYNYPIQCLATAEIIPIAVTYFWHRVREEGLEDKIVLVNTVHDSIVCEVHPDYTEDYRRISIQAFTHDVYTYLEKVYNMKFDFVPLGVGITLGSHWSEGEEEQYNVFYDGKVEKIEK